MANPDNTKDWDSLREFARESNQPCPLLDLIDLLQLTGAKLPTSSIVCEDGEMAIEWRDGNRIISWELDGLLLMVDCKCVNFDTFLEARNDQP